MPCLFILLFIIQNIIHQKIIKYSIENNVFLFLRSFKMRTKKYSPVNARKCEPKSMKSISLCRNLFQRFGNLIIWLWKSFGKNSEGACTNPDKNRNSPELATY